MKRRQFIQQGAAIAVAGGSVVNQEIQASRSKIFIHHVYFWLANPDSKEDLHQLIEGLRKLSKVPKIKQYHIGVPAGTSRDVIDGSYQVSWCLFFKDAKAEEIYQKHPLHLKFIEENKHLWKKVVVYDSIDV